MFLLPKTRISVGLALIVLLVVALVPSTSCADSTALQIEIFPRGSVVELDGPQYTITGSPNVIPRPATGWYEMKASYPGYETWKQGFYLDTGTPVSITGRLNAKTRSKAGLRAVFFPGWGHYYSDRKTTGVIMTVATLGMVGGYVYFALRADRKADDYENALKEFDAANSVTVQKALLSNLLRTQQSALDAQSDQQTWGWLTLGVYVYQILDAIIFFPEAPHVDLGGVELGLAVPDGQTVGLRAHYEF